MRQIIFAIISVIFVYFSTAFVLWELPLDFAGMSIDGRLSFLFIALFGVAAGGILEVGSR